MLQFYHICLIPSLSVSLSLFLSLSMYTFSEPFESKLQHSSLLLNSSVCVFPRHRLYLHNPSTTIKGKTLILFNPQIIQILPVAPVNILKHYFSVQNLSCFAFSCHISLVLFNLEKSLSFPFYHDIGIFEKYSPDTFGMFLKFSHLSDFSSWLNSGYTFICTY